MKKTLINSSLGGVRLCRTLIRFANQLRLDRVSPYRRLALPFALLTLAFSLQPLAFAGTNAAVTFNTNTGLSPSWYWGSNASSIATALNGIGFAPSGSTQFADPLQMLTNGAGELHIFSLAESNMVGIISNANLGASLATLNSNLDTGLTNAAGQTISQAIAASNNAVSNSLATAITNATNNPTFSLPGNAAVTSNLTARSATITSNLAAQSLTITSNATAKAVLTTNVSSSGASMNIGDGSGLYLWTDDNAGQLGLTNNGSISGNAPCGILLDSHGFVDIDGGPLYVKAGMNISGTGNYFEYGQTGTSSFSLNSTTVGNSTMQELMDLGPASLTTPDYLDKIVVTGNSNLYNIRLGSRGDIFYTTLWHPFTNISGLSAYTADWGDRRILCNPTSTSCQITLPALGAFGYILPTAATAKSWTAGNAVIVGGTGEMDQFVTQDYYIANLGSNTANTLKVQLADGTEFTNFGVSDLIIPNQMAARFTTLNTNGGLAVVAEFYPLSLSPAYNAVNMTNLNPAALNPALGTVPWSALSNTNWTGDIAFPNTSILTLANGPNAGIVLTTNVYFVLSGLTGPFSIAGIAQGRDGRDIVLINPTGYAMTINNDSGLDPAPTNRIATGANGDMTFTNTPTYVSLHYVGASNMWQVQNFNALSSTTLILPSGLITNGNASPVIVSNTVTSTSNIIAQQFLGATNSADSVVCGTNGVAYLTGYAHSCSGCTIHFTHAGDSGFVGGLAGAYIIATNTWPHPFPYGQIPAMTVTANDYLANDINSLIGGIANGGLVILTDLSTTNYCVVGAYTAGTELVITSTSDAFTIVTGAGQ